MIDKFDEWKNAIDNNIDKLLDEELSTWKSADVKKSFEELKRLSKGGKKIRGALIKIGELLNGVDNDSYLPLATAFEIFQTAVLIHDDIIDEADTRRGMPTITALIPGHDGLSKAICVGDLGFFLSYKIISETNFSDSIKAKLIEFYTKTLYNTIVGEIIDVELPLKDFNYHLNMKDDEIYDIYMYKTSWYTFIGPLLLGAIAANMDDDKINSIIEIGLNLGIAYQIRDDLLGLYSTNDNMGKTSTDIKENKQTIIYKYAIDHANDEERKIIESLYGKELNEEDTKTLIDLFTSLNAKDNAERLVKEHTDKAINIINDSDFENKQYLIDLAEKLVARNK
jgi:geranylgeranyl pyrophosphate synthase